MTEEQEQEQEEESGFLGVGRDKDATRVNMPKGIKMQRGRRGDYS